ncbi:testis-expressed protein 9-like [Haliotis rufescens]|uniref:testis-expressed protein 9-like n=1 Tax=Haliotis rufescens TaxID=6454 RepID=UPI001EB057B2|nr:testis-expressed protein 9-like [Haliotis rufescens]
MFTFATATMSESGNSRVNLGGEHSPAPGRPRLAGARTKQTSADDIRTKEEQYKRLNEELEAKTATLVREAEQVMRDQEAALSKSRLLDNINTEDFLKEFDEDLTGQNEDTQRKPSSRPDSKLSNKDSRSASRNKSSARSKPKESCKTNTMDESAFLTDFVDLSLTKRIHQMEQTLTEDDDPDNDILPHTAADMGTEATIRFLKAKLRVMQEELDRLSQETRNKDEELRQLSSHVREVEEDRGRHMRTVATQQTQIDKYKKVAEDARTKSDSAENQLSTVRKEVEQLKRSQKQAASSHSATEVRLNRALEEVERYKEQLQKSKSLSKDASDSDKKRVEHLLADNKKLEKQKSELMAGFKKQLKLIDILKRQKMHIEAAKMLQFSEEEFVKALEWGN